MKRWLVGLVVLMAALATIGCSSKKKGAAGLDGQEGEAGYGEESLGGGAQGGIVPWSLTKAPEVAKLGTATLLPAQWHRPLRQTMVLMKSAGPQAVAFHAYLGSPEARTIFVRHGFSLPGESG